MDEKYTNYFIEGLTATMNDAILRTINTQVSLRIANESIQEILNANKGLADQNTKLITKIEEMTRQSEYLANVSIDVRNKEHQLIHLETFKKDLVNVTRDLETAKITIKKLEDENQALKNSGKNSKKRFQDNSVVFPPVVTDGNSF